MDADEYAKWDKFCSVREKAQRACANAGENPDNHFLRVGKMIALAKGAHRANVRRKILRLYMRTPSA